jgi:prepilin-type N-terminal cleavage/methylation domain-containing protein
MNVPRNQPPLLEISRKGPRIRTRSLGAFSLVEVMCAVLILGIGVAGLSHGITAALRSSKESELQTSAALLAAGQIETLRAEGFVIDEETEGEAGDDLPLFRWRQTVKSTQIDGLHEVTVVVEHARTGNAIYELRTLLFDPPLDDLPPSSSTTKQDSTKPGRRDRFRP